MTIFNVVTESMSEYRVDTENGFWSKDCYPVRFRLFKSSVVDDPGLPWNSPEHWENVTEPVIGRRMYFSSLEAWQISTNVVSIEVVSG